MIAFDQATQYRVERKRFDRAWERLRYHEEQQKLWKCTKRFIGVPAGRRSGKTVLAHRKLVRALPILKPWSDPRYFYAAPTEKQAKRLAWKKLLALIPQNWIKGDPHVAELYIETKFGSSIYVVGLDKPQRLEGDGWDGGVVDESCDVKPEAVSLSIGPALGDRFGWLWRIGVPKRQGVGAQDFREFCEKAAKGTDPDEASFSWPSSDIQPQKVLAYYQRNMDPKDYAEQWDASWQKAGGKIFHAYGEHNTTACSFHPNLPLIIGCDFNVDPMAWIFGHLHEGGEYIEWFDELWERDTNTQKCLKLAWEKYGQHTKAGVKFYGDATNKSDHTSASESDYQQIINHKEFKKKRSTVHFLKSNPAKIDRFAACNAVFKNALGDVRCFIDERVKHLRVDVINRGFKKNSNEPDDKGNDSGHASDAMGYPIHILFPIIEQDEVPTVIIKTPKKSGSKSGTRGGNGKGGNGRPSVTAVPMARRGNGRTNRSRRR